MKLRNKKTGEIGVLNVSNNKYHVIAYGLPLCGNSVLGEYDTLDALMQEWQDYEEPSEFYIVEHRGAVNSRFRTGDRYEKNYKEIGNYFNTKEEAEKAVEKLKAWKRLKDKGFKFTGYDLYSGSSAEDKTKGELAIIVECSDFVDDKDLDLLFRGEE